MGRRAELLAARIEEGANGLAAFAEKLSEADWKAPGATGGKTGVVGEGAAEDSMGGKELPSSAYVT